ncbi:tRNA uridine 5-carboxymethylaminomethyl modification enzyme MnmG [Bienertia sinuspersici]
MLYRNTKGNTCSSTIFGRDIDSFANSLNILGHYYISNAMVKPIAEKPSHSFQEVVLIDQELKPKILTLWNEFASNEGEKISQIIQTQPIIVGMRLKVISFMVIANEEKIQCHQQLSSSFYNSLKDPNVANVIQISTLLADDKVIKNLKCLTWWIKASASITNYNQNFGTLVAMCVGGPPTQIMAKHSPVEIAQDKNVWQKQVIFSYNSLTCIHICIHRCRFLIELVDSTGTITAMVFGKSAEKIFEVDALKLMQFCDKVNSLNIKIIIAITGR